MSVFAKPAAKNKCPNCTSRACGGCRTWELRCHCGADVFTRAAKVEGDIEIACRCLACDPMGEQRVWALAADVPRGHEVQWDGNGRIRG